MNNYQTFVFVIVDELVRCGPFVDCLFRHGYVTKETQTFPVDL